MGGDDFLGEVCLPLQDFDVYEKPKAGWVMDNVKMSRQLPVHVSYDSWYPLVCKPWQKKTG